MKKILCMLMTVMLLCTAFAAIAETTGGATPEATEAPAFDKLKLTGSDLYHYDKFSKEWNVQGAYVKEYRNAVVKVALLLFDTYVEEGWGPELRVQYFDKDSQTYDEVTAFRAIVGEKIFSWENMQVGTNSSCVISGEVLKAFCQELRAGGAVAFQIDYTDKYGSSWTTTIDPVESSALSELRTMAHLFNNSHAWSIDQSPWINDIMFEASME